MTRQERRKLERQDAKAASQDQRRANLISVAYAFLEAAASNDQTVSGATLILPSGEVQYLPRPPASGRRS